MKTRIGHAHGRRLLSLLLALVICFGAIGLGTLTASAANRTGDTDGDGKVTAKDARFVLRLSARLETATAAQKAAAEVDGDGRITAKDARIILRVSARLTTFESAGKVEANRQKVQAAGREVQAYLSGNFYFAGYYYIDTESSGIPCVMACFGGNRLIYFNTGNHPLAQLSFGKNYYWMDPDTALCLPMTAGNTRALGLTYDTSSLDAVIPDLNYALENADIRSYQINVDGTLALCTEVHYTGSPVTETHISVGDKMVSTQITDSAGNLLFAYVYSTVTESIPNGLLAASSYGLVNDVNEFKRLTGMS